MGRWFRGGTTAGKVGAPGAGEGEVHGQGVGRCGVNGGEGGTMAGKKVGTWWWPTFVFDFFFFKKLLFNCKKLK